MANQPLGVIVNYDVSLEGYVGQRVVVDLAAVPHLLREGIGLIGAGTPAGSRMAEHAAYVELVSKELPGVVQRWEEYKASLPAYGA